MHDVHEKAESQNISGINSVNTLVTFPNKLVGSENVHSILLNGAVVRSLIDTGSQVSLISKSLYDRYFSYIELKPVDQVINLKGVTGDVINHLGVVELFVRLGSKLSGTNDGYHVQFLVVDDLAGMPVTHGDSLCLVGMNAIENIWFYSDDRKTSVLDFVYTGLTKVAAQEDAFQTKLKLTESVSIPPKSTRTLKCTLRSKLVGVTVPLHIELCLNNVESRDLMVNGNLSSYTKVSIPVHNSKDVTVELDAGDVVGHVSIAPIPFRLDDDVNISVLKDLNIDEHTDSESKFVQSNHPGMVDEEDEDVTPDMRQLYNHVKSLSHLSTDDKNDLLAVITDNDEVFSKTEYDIGNVKGVKHSYVLDDRVPFKVRHRNLPPRMYAAARDHLNQLLDKGIIRPSISPYSSAPMFLQKPDGRVRMVTDLRYLNAKTVRDCYALPRFDDILPYLANSVYFSKMDIRSGYYNIEVAEEDKEKTAFSTVFGLYEYNRMVQGAKTSAATFQRCMENILRPMLYRGAVAFLDDVIIYSRTKEEHLKLLDEAFRLMRQAGLKLHPGKCTMMSEEIVYLGHVISKEGVKVNTDKTKALRDWKKLQTVKDVLSFLGFCGYFRRHIPNFSTIAKPLQQLCEGVKYKPKSKFGPPVRQPALSKSIVELWTTECQLAMDRLIEALSEPPVLIFPDLEKTFILHVDACTTGLGAVLLQFGSDKLLHPVCYASRGLKSAEKNYPSYKLEFLALKWAVVDKFNFYLYGREFKVYTDNNPLTYIHKTLKVDATSQRWLAALGEYDFSIHYKPGKTNIDADILSRLHEDQLKVCTVSVTGAELLHLDPVWSNYVDVTNLDTKDIGMVRDTSTVMDWKSLQNSDSELNFVKDLLQQQGELKTTDFPKAYRKLFFYRDSLLFRDGILYKHVVLDGLDYDTIVLPKSQMPVILRKLHDESGHLGVDRIYKLFQRRFYLSGSHKIIGHYIESCPNCLVKKTPVNKKTVLGRVTASRPFQVVSMDFLKLDENPKGYKKVLVVTDVFTKYAFAFPTKNELALNVAKILVDQVFNVFGLPEKLLSDRGRNFESDVIKQLCNLLGVKKVFTCPYSPRSDAVCERFNRTLIGMLGTLSEKKRTEWHKYVPHLVSIYNSTQHAATNFAPFELLFGRKSRLPVDIVLGIKPDDVEFASIKEYVRALKEKLETCHAVAREMSELQHLENKHRYDKKVKSVVLKVGDKVLVRSVGIKGEHKLEPIWMPEVYKVTRVVDNRVYEVTSVKSPKKVRVLHLDMLKPLDTLESMYHCTRSRGNNPLEQLEDEVLQELFDNSLGDQVPDLISRPKQEMAMNYNQVNSQKSRKSRRLRSRKILHSSSSISGDSSESDDVHKESSHSELLPADGEIETKHAPNKISQEIDENQLLGTKTQYLQQGIDSPIAVSDSEDCTPSGDLGSVPIESTDFNDAEIRIPPAIGQKVSVNRELADCASGDSESSMTETSYIPEEVGVAGRGMPARINRGVPPARFGYDIVSAVRQWMHPPVPDSKIMIV